MKKTNELVKFSGHLQSVVTEISKGLEKKGVNVVEAIEKLAQPESAAAIEKIIDVMANLVTDASLESSDIVSFFQNKTSIKLYFGDNFKKWVLSQQPKEFPKVSASTKVILSKRMTDEEIIKEYKITPYSISEVLAVLYDKISKQPNGENGELMNDGYTNLFYVKLDDDRVVVMSAFWVAGGREWNLYAFDLVDDRWNDGYYVFSRS